MKSPRPYPNDYSLTRLIRALASPGRVEDQIKQSPEMDHSATVLQDEVGRAPRMGGAFIPLRPVAVGLSTQTNVGGGYLLGQAVSNRIAAALRAQLVLAKASAITMFGLKNSLTLTIQSAFSSATWVSENPGVDLAQQDSSFAAAKLTPHALSANTSISRQLLDQASPDVEDFILQDLTRAIAVAVDAAGLAGTGNENQPLGIANTSGTN